jgi:RNA 2',3'-cyclic 3'-phosphodiesterase
MSTTGTIRTFICIELPQTVQALLAKFQDSLKRLGADVSWVEPSNIHLTLKFLGDVPEPMLATLSSIVEKAAFSTVPFELQVNGAGFFPNLRAPRVLWVAIQPVPQQLQDLQEWIDVELFKLGIAREDRKFSPHLTIGRVKSPRNLQALVSAMHKLDISSEIVTAREVTVMKSDLRPTGALYTPIKVFPLLGKAEQK